MSNTNGKFHKACGLVLAATLVLAACANQTGDWAAPADESAAREDTQSASQPSKAWEFDCKFDRLRDLPLDLVIGLPVCMAGSIVIGGAIAALGLMMTPVIIADWVSKQSPASDVETQADGETN